MTTKEQERQAIEKIRKIVEGLGENSYVGFAMEGVLELAEDNIREDTAYSMKKNAEIAWEREDKAEKENKDLKKEVEDLKKTVEKREATISELNTELCNARAEAKANEIPEELVAIRGHDEVTVIEVILPANKVKESFDHSVQFLLFRQRIRSKSTQRHRKSSCMTITWKEIAKRRRTQYGKKTSEKR